MPLSPASSAPNSPRDRVTAAISSAAEATGVDFGYLYRQAKIESGLDPSAKARTSSARGLYQFTDQTWLATLKQHGGDHGFGWAADNISRSPGGRYQVADKSQRDLIFGLRDQPEAASAMAAEFASDNGTYLEDRLNRDVEPVDLYLAHFLGAEGAARFLTSYAADPDAAAAPILPAAAAANRAIFYGSDGRPRSLAEIREGFAAKLNQPQSEPAPSPFVPTHRSSRITRTMDAHASLALNLRTIEPMPSRLSLDFARRAYQTLSHLDGRSST